LKSINLPDIKSKITQAMSPSLNEDIKHLDDQNYVDPDGLYNLENASKLEKETKLTKYHKQIS
jgi:hypothetical protein